MTPRAGSVSRTRFSLSAGDFRLELGASTKIMGVLNVTPDSFSDGGDFTDPDRALEQALRMEAEGADILDVGGESTRPGSAGVSAREEIRRVVPVLKRLAGRVRVPVSIDTSKEEVAAAALEEGAVIVNDVRGLRGNRKLGQRIAAARAAVVLMHMSGTPAVMQKKASYENVVADVRAFLARAAAFARACGIANSSIAVDPGFGFGKTPAHNLELLRELRRFSPLGFPLLVGLSRKSFLGYYSGVERPADRLAVSLGAAAAAVVGGAHIVRVHDVKPHREMLDLIDRTLTGDGTT